MIDSCGALDVPKEAPKDPEERELPVDELEVLSGPGQEVPTLQLLGYEPTGRNVNVGHSRQLTQQMNLKIAIQSTIK